MRIFGLLFCALVAACYSTPERNCAFRCGTNNECPSGYACGPDDDVCHRVVSGELAECEVTMLPDAETAIDAKGAVDARGVTLFDAPGTGGEPDAPIIVDEPDAPVTSTPDAPVTTTPDAKVTTTPDAASAPDAPADIDAGV